MRQIICTVGLPRSGKSTWAKQSGYPVVNLDSVRLALYGERYLEQAEPMVWNIGAIMLEALLLAGHDRVVVDECNVTEVQRDRWRQVGQRLGAGMTFKAFAASPEECKQRAEALGDERIIPVIDRMADEWDLPICVEWWLRSNAEKGVDEALRGDLERGINNVTTEESTP
jgi:predicted kinase